MTYVYRVPLPPAGVGSNSRAHWSVRSKVTREYREECTSAYLVAGLPERPIERAHIDVEMRVCRKRLPERPPSWWTADEFRAWMAARDRYRPKDRPNVLDACKATIDALQPPSAGIGAGVIVSDDSRYVTVGAPGLTVVESFAEEGVWITVMPQEAER